jgi:hypothetical protein
VCECTCVCVCVCVWVGGFQKMADVTKYVAGLAALMTQRNGKGFAQEIALPFVNGNKRINRLHLQLVETAKKSNVESLCISKFRDPNIASIVTHRIAALVAVCGNEYVAGWYVLVCISQCFVPERLFDTVAYQEMNIVYSACMDYVSGGDSEAVAWLNLLLVRISDDIRIVADLADKAQDDAQSTLLREVITTITKGWTLAVKDRAPVSESYSKKLIVLALSNILFKIYFALNSLSLCSKLIDIIEGPTCRGMMDEIELLPVCDVVMFKYYHGRLMMFEDKYENARALLRMALRYCPKSFVKNRQRILSSLIPVEMCLGVFPSRYVATQYGFTEMVDLATAARQGDFQSFDAIMSQHQISFIKVGIYLVLEQVRAIVVRNFFKRVCFVLENTRVSLETVEVAYRYFDPEGNLDLIECLLANLIFQGKVKGYMSHQKRMLILSKTDPFPTNTVVVKWR